MKKFIWPVALGALIVFIFTAFSVSRGSSLAFDTEIQEAFFCLRSSWLDPLVIGLTHLGDTTSIVVICVLLLIVPATRIRYGLPVSLAAIAASSLNHYLKTVFLRPRPDEGFFLIEQGGWSFPSGHSISALVVFGLLILLVQYFSKERRNANIISGILLIPCFGIGLSRIYVGVHFPTDVLAGWCLGTIIICIAFYITQFFSTYKR